jgi:hypothetical protein
MKFFISRISLLVIYTPAANILWPANGRILSTAPQAVNRKLHLFLLAYELLKELPEWDGIRLREGLGRWRDWHDARSRLQDIAARLLNTARGTSHACLWLEGRFGRLPPPLVCSRRRQFVRGLKNSLIQVRPGQ